MPPPTPNPLAPRDTTVKALSKGEDHILSLMDMGGWGMAVAATNFDQMEWADTLIQLVRHPDPKVSLSALREFRQTMFEMAKVNGLITTSHAEATDQDENRKIKRTITQQRLVSGMLSDRERLQNAKDATEGPHVVKPLLGESPEIVDEPA